eukprot:COSAG01_NODE_61905_length_287_cov_0.824468_1_plen_54_part_01
MLSKTQNARLVPQGMNPMQHRQHANLVPSTLQVSVAHVALACQGSSPIRCSQRA